MPWRDAWAIACACAIIHANQEKTKLGRVMKSPQKAAWVDTTHAKF